VLPVTRRDPESVRRSLTGNAKAEHAAKLRVQGKTWQQIADEVGFSGRGAACKAVTDYFRKAPPPDVETMRAIENEKLDEREQDLLKILVAEHIVVQNGKVVTRFVGWMTDDDGQVMRDHEGKMVPKLEEVVDHDPIIRVVNVLLAVYTRRAKLNGLDAQIEKGDKEDESVDEEIRQLVQEMTEAGNATVLEAHPESMKASK
jgi:hypothetical protein